MLLKILRLGHISVIKGAMIVARDFLTNWYPRKKVEVERDVGLITVCITFILSVHFVACGWLLVIKYQGNIGLMEVFTAEDLVSEYVNAVYLMT